LACAALGLEGDATLAQIGEELIRLPGLAACFLTVRHQSGHGGQLPDRFEPEAARALARQLASALDGSAEKLGSGRVQHLTIFAEDYCVSFFTQAEATVCAIHRTRSFLPGVRERLAAAATALAQA
jgi:plasmid stabilization system protein ParE